MLSTIERSSLDELIARLKEARYHLRELDARIWAHIDQRVVRRDGSQLLAKSLRPFHSDECVLGEFTPNGFHTSLGHRPEIPHYTKSIDDGLRLVPKHYMWCVQVTGDGGRAVVGPMHGAWKEAGAATPQLALCIAALRARFEKD